VDDAREPLKQYETVASLGAGGMADVYLAVAKGGQGFRKLVVVKKVRTPLSDDPELLRMFEQEARLAARLNHPNIVQTLDFGEHEGGHAIVMEYLEGQSLSTIVRRAPPEGIPLALSLEVLVEVLAALDYAHQLTDFGGEPLHIVHRDISPHNVFVTYAGQTKLVDFGVAKALPDPYATTGTMIKGKLAYMSPEHERGDPVDARADLFAVGVMLWEALVGRRMWAGLSEIAIISRLRFGEIPSPHEASSEVPNALEHVCMRALAHRREDRYQSAAEFRRELQTCISQLDLQASPDDVGAFVTRLFAQERARLQEIVRTRFASQPEVEVPSPASLATSTDAPTPSTPPHTPSRASPRRAAVVWGLAALLVTFSAGLGALSLRLDAPEPSAPGTVSVEQVHASPSVPPQEESKPTAAERLGEPPANDPIPGPDATVAPVAGPVAPKPASQRAAVPPAMLRTSQDAGMPLEPGPASPAPPTAPDTTVRGRVRFDDPWAPTSSSASHAGPLAPEGQP
jgi:serine/threonine-protein kinase